MEAKDKNTKVVFKNEPKLSEHEVQKNMNERRISLVPQIKDYLTNHPRFKDKEVHVTFVHKGAGSLVCIVETTGEKLVLKIRLSSKNSSEALFLKTWETAGVKVPHIFENGTMSGHDYVLMEYIDAPALKDALSNEELISKGIYYKLGNILSIMHEPEAYGYGDAVNGKAEYTNFVDWVRSETIKKKIDYVKENKLLDDQDDSLDSAIQILTKYTEIQGKSSYCHDDFGTQNIFYTEPMTVFDPNSVFNDRYIDLGSYIAGPLVGGGLFPEQFVSGYFSDGVYDKKVLHAAVLLNTYLKIWRLHRVKKLTGLENIKKYLAKNKHLLD